MATITLLTTRQYSDLDLSFTRNPNTGDVSIKKNQDAVSRAIRNLIFTQHYERPFHPEIGCRIYRLLFEPMTPYTTIEIQNSVSEVINNFEPRANLINVIVQANYDAQRYDVIINYEVINVNEPVTLSFYLERSR